METTYTEVFAWGGDTFGQLGLATKKKRINYCIPRYCSYSIIIRQISCGEEHTAFISDEMSVYTIGSNTEGRLGIGDTSIKYSSSPCLLEGLRATSINCGWGHTAVITEAHEVYAWGVGEFGALGNGSMESQWTPMKMETEIHATAISCGSRHTAILDRHSRLLTCGAGDAGQLGSNRREKELTPIVVYGSSKVMSVDCGVFHTLFVNESGKVFGMGGNTFGQLGINSKKSTAIPLQVTDLDHIFIKKVACGQHSAAISENGCLYIWGTGVFGEFYVPQKVETLNTVITDVSLGGGFGAVVDNNGLVWTWGSNASGELGMGDFEPRITPFPVIALQGKTVTSLSCGGSYIMALGRNVSASDPNDGFQSTGEQYAFDSQGLNSLCTQPVSYREGPPTLTSQPLASPMEQSIDVLQLRFEDLKRDNMREIDRRVELDKQLAESCAKNQQLWMQISAIKDENDQIQSLRDENLRLQSETSEISFFKEENDRLKTQLEKIKDLKDENLTLRRDVNLMQTVQDENQRLKAKNTELYKDSSQVPALNSTISQLHDEMSVMKSRITTLSEDCTSLTQSRTALANENQQIIKLKCEMELLEGDIRQQKNQIQSLQEKNQYLESKVEEAEGQRASEHEQKISLQTELDVMKTQKRLSEEHLHEVELKFAAERNNLQSNSEAERKRIQTDSEFERTRIRAEFEEERARLQAENRDLSSRLADLDRLYLESNDARRKVEGDLKGVDNAAKHIENELNVFRVHAQSEMKILENRLQATSEEKIQLQRCLNKATEEQNKLQVALNTSREKKQALKIVLDEEKEEKQRFYGNLNTARQEKESLSGQINNYQHELSMVKVQLANVNQNFAGLEKSHADALATNRVQINEQNTHLKTMQTHNTELQAQSNELMQTIEQLATAMQELEATKLQLEQEKEELKAKNVKIFKSLEKAVSQRAKDFKSTAKQALSNSRSPTPPQERSRSRYRSLSMKDRSKRSSSAHQNRSLMTSDELAEVAENSSSPPRSRLSPVPDAQPQRFRVSSRDELYMSQGPPPMKELLESASERLARSAAKAAKNRSSDLDINSIFDKENSMRKSRFSELKSKLSTLRQNKAALESQMRNI